MLLVAMDLAEAVWHVSKPNPRGLVAFSYNQAYFVAVRELQAWVRTRGYSSLGPRLM
jgi:hypothetical protein